MTVLFILGTITAVLVLLLIVSWINNFSEKRFGYQFFNYGNLAIISIGYFMIIFGESWYSEALANNGDILNGQLLIGIGVTILISTLINHIRKTTFWFGTTVGVFQFLLYIPLSFLAAFALLIVIAWLSETKPVYRL